MQTLQNSMEKSLNVRPTCSISGENNVKVMCTYNNTFGCTIMSDGLTSCYDGTYGCNVTEETDGWCYIYG